MQKSIEAGSRDRYIKQIFSWIIVCIADNLVLFLTHMQDRLSSFQNNHLVVVSGPTAVGKTGFCIDLARVFDTQIISADSRQFYQEMNIGTAKPTFAEMKGIKHHFIDFLSIKDSYNAYNFEKDVVAFLSEWFKKNSLAIMTGGSGLYVDAVCNGLDEIPDTPPDIRDRLNQELEEKGLQTLVDRLKEADPDYYENVDIQNPTRVIRGLEVFETSGKPFSSFRRGEKAQRDFKVVKIGLQRDREELNARIESRMDEMIASGLFEEAELLFPFKEYRALNTVGYKEIFDYKNGVYNRDEAVRLLKRNSRRYAKRQMTWFKKDREYAWFHPDEFDRVVRYIQESVGLKE